MKKSLFILLPFLALILSSCSTEPFKELDLDENRAAYSNYLKDGRIFHARNLKRTFPKEETGNLSNYPYPGNSYGKGTTPWPSRDEIYQENEEVLKAGKEDLLTKGTLKKYRGAYGLYTGQNIPDEALAVDMTLNISHGELGFHSTGLYAGPGEMIDVYISTEDIDYMNSMPSGLNSFKIAVGQTAQRDFVTNNIPANKIDSSLPLRSIQYTLGEIMRPLPAQPNIYHGLVGSPLGGPIYFFLPQDASSLPNVSIRFKGALESLYYRQGVTSINEWSRMVKEAPGQYADIMADTVRFSGPATAAIRNNLDIDKSMEFWYKQQQLAIDFDRSGSWYVSRPITQFHDYYVPVGAAVAIVNANRSFLPTGWMGSSLDYDNIMAGGVWGQIHELNHHHQHFSQQLWGMQGGGEITNNVVNAMSYSFYTNCGKSRTEAGGAKDWKYVCDPYNNLKKTLVNTLSNTNQYVDLSFYVDIFHYFGYETMKNFAYSNRGNTESTVEANDKAYKNLVEITGMDFTHYLETSLHWDLSNSAKSDVQAKKLPMFYPVASPYQRSHDGNRATTTPFIVSASTPTILNFESTLITTSPVKKVLKISQPKGKALVNNNDGTFTFNPKKAGDRYAFDVDIELDQGQKITLNCEVEKDQSSLTAEIYDVSGEVENHLDNLEPDKLLKNKSPIETIKTRKTNIPSYKIADSEVKKTLARVKFDLLPSEDTTYELAIFGTKEVKLCQDQKTLLTTTSTTNNFNSVPSIKLKLKAGERLKMTLYSLGTNSGRAEFGWRTLEVKGDEEDDFGDISNPSYENFAAPGGKPSDLYREDSFPDLFSKQLSYRGTIASEPGDLKVVGVSPTDQTCSSSEEVKNPKGSCSGGDGTMDVIVDGDKNSFWHSQYNSSSPDYPYIIFIQNISKKSFNAVKMIKRNHQNPFLNKFDIYVGENPKIEEMKKIYSNDDASNKGTLEIDLDKTYHSSYIALFAREGGNGSSQNYLAIAEFQIMQKFSSNQIYGFDSAGLKYSGKWNYTPNGNSLRGVSVTGEDGASLSFKYFGRGLGLTASQSPLMGSGKITIDGQEYTFDTTSATKSDNQLVFATELSRGYHQVKITVDKGSAINLNSLMLVDAENRVSNNIASTILITILVSLAAIIIGVLILNRVGLLEIKFSKRKGGIK